MTISYNNRPTIRTYSMTKLYHFKTTRLLKVWSYSTSNIRLLNDEGMNSLYNLILQYRESSEDGNMELPAG